LGKLEAMDIQGSPAVQDIESELRIIFNVGLGWCTPAKLPAVSLACVRAGLTNQSVPPMSALDRLIDMAIDAIPDTGARECAGACFGIPEGRWRSHMRRRKAAASVIGISAERFRHGPESQVLAMVAAEILELFKPETSAGLPSVSNTMSAIEVRDRTRRFSRFHDLVISLSLLLSGISRNQRDLRMLNDNTAPLDEPSLERLERRLTAWIEEDSRLALHAYANWLVELSVLNEEREPWPRVQAVTSREVDGLNGQLLWLGAQLTFHMDSFQLSALRVAAREAPTEIVLFERSLSGPSVDNSIREQFRSFLASCHCNPEQVLIPGSRCQLHRNRFLFLEAEREIKTVMSVLAPEAV
jgi:hypothetical protein